ncbi:LacI family DNA-binding transcriptional regulator [Rhodobium gokarnense]|uniref:LacI family transcriptional regulator n=1 Tax=Rhodobium gokarnense TaxID=364296 RepID=A0ABT3HAZ4_9HYPH|nr:LacI family DNA-binding transcriptional regulator [Rhodobium gokarnense]MCW2307567.1 LacI family transcriptional regulator [Rhodobium gokarnense]
MSDKPVSIRDVAKKAGVSPGTVSNVLTGRKPVNKDLADHVRKVAAELGYQTDRLASQLRTGKAQIIAVLVPDLDNPFFTSIVSAIEGCVSQENYEIIVANSNDDEETERSRLAAILAWRPAGIVVIPSTDRFPNRDLIERAGVPYVIADRVTHSPQADTVSVANEEAGAMAARHLLDLGHRRILLAASVLGLGNMRERCAGAARVIEAAGAPAPEVLETGLTFEVASERLSKWLDGHERPTAIIGFTNFTTLGVLTALVGRNIRIPDEMSVIGFDDYKWMCARSVPITAIRQPIQAMGQAIWSRLRSRIGGDTCPPMRVYLSCELIVRASAAAIGPKGQETSNASDGNDQDNVREMARPDAGTGIKPGA